MPESLPALAQSLVDKFIAPLVLGGEMRLLRPIGPKRAEALAHQAAEFEPAEGWAHVQMARVRIARLVAPLDALMPPTGDEWRLFVAIHDLFLATHPDYNQVFRKPFAKRVLQAAVATLTSISAPKTVGDALSRHTWFAHVLDVRRTDVSVSWWTGSATFRGGDAPSRLLAMPKLRRVKSVSTRVAPANWANHSAVDSESFFAALGTWLALTPLTDVMTATREAPLFSWSKPTLGLMASVHGQRYALRAIARCKDPAALANKLRSSWPAAVGACPF